MMLRILLGRFHPYVQILVGRIVIGYYATLAWYKSRGKQPVVHVERPYSGQKILVVALYQKGWLRPDMYHLMAIAREQGYYVIAVNTLRLKEPQRAAEVCDCYIERSNFGRDFGSYKTAFLQVYDRSWHEQCPRLLMLNDSNFYSMTRTSAFLSDMMSSDREVLGSTENYEIQHHLGSFCICMAGSVLRNPAMLRYWRDYRLSDIRPKVIRRGEVGLTKVLKRVATSPDQFGALYSVTRYAEELHRNPELLQFAIANSRRSELIWKNTGAAGKLVQRILSKHSVETAAETADYTGERGQAGGNHEMIGRQSGTGAMAAKLQWVSDYPTLMYAITAQVKNPEQVKESTVHRSLIAELVDNFLQGSQIHQNGAILLRMGLPLIKLDSVYRGAANMEDVEIMMSELEPAEARIARGLLLQRPYGDEFLYGWRLGAFKGGYL